MTTNTINRCELCTRERQADYVINTGVSAYAACRACLDRWLASDQTVQALRELQGRGVAR